MSYNKKDLLALSDQEKLALAEDLWDSVGDDMITISKEELAFAEERMKMHEQNPDEGLTWEEFRKKITDRHGF